MHTIKQNAERQFVETLETIRPVRSSWRAQLFKFSLMAESAKREALQKIAFGVITEHLADKRGFVFFFHDEDLIVLGDGISRKALEEIIQSIDAHKQDGTGPAVKLYDVGVEWEALYGFGRDKERAYHNIAQKSKLKQEDNKAQSTGPIFNAQTGVQLVQQGRIKRKQRQKPCVLLVEDDPLSLHLAKKTLEGDYEIVTAIDGARALEAYVMHVPDVVFLDIGLPDTSGQDVLVQCLTLDPDGCIVMLSGQSFREEIVKAMHAGAKGFVGKPFTRAKLLHYINLCTGHSDA